MKHIALALPALLLSAAVEAQPLQVVLPTAPADQSHNFPVAGPPMRYQQWFAPSQLAQTVRRPVRINRLEFIGGSPGGQTGAQIDIEVTLGNGPPQPSFLMDQNLTNPQSAQPLPPVIVYPRRIAPQPLPTLATAVAGAPVLTLDFAQPFVWDGSSALVVDFKLFDNGKGNRPYPYDLLVTALAVGTCWRMWGLGPNPHAISTAGFTQPSVGAVMRFTYAEGVTVPFGSGCPGAAGVVPVASTSGGLPIAPNPGWTQTLANANSGVNALLMFGTSRHAWVGIPLPLELRFLGAPFCFLNTEVLISVPATTVGGGPGTGTASVRTPVPGVTVLFGISVFTQWWVADPQAPNRLVALTPGLWHVFG